MQIDLSNIIELLTGGGNTWVILIGLVVLFLRRGNFGPTVDGILDILRQILNRPAPPSEAEVKARVLHSSHVHDMRTEEGRICAVRCISNYLRAKGKTSTAATVRATLPDMIDEEPHEPDTE